MQSESFFTLLHQGFMSVDYVIKNNKTEEGIKDNFNVVRKARNPFLLPISDDDVINVYQQHPKLRDFLFLSTDADGLILLDTKTLKSTSAVSLLLGVNNPKMKKIQNRDEDYLSGLQKGLTASHFTYPYPEPVEVLKDLVTLITMTQTSRVEGIFNLIDFKSLLVGASKNHQAYQQIVRYIYLYTRKIIEYPTPEFDKKLCQTIKHIPRNIDSLNNELRKLVEDMEIPVAEQERTLYRGDTARNIQRNPLHYQKSLSWTPKYETAQFFAKRFSNPEGSQGGKIYTVNVPAKYILAEYADDGEPECLLDPAVWKQKPEVKTEIC